MFLVLVIQLAGARPAHAALTVTLAPDKASPQLINTTIGFTASASGGSGPFEYRFFLKPPGGSYGEVQAYGTDNTWPWTPAAIGKYYIMVYARTVGSTSSYEGTYAMSYQIIPPAVSWVSLAADLPSPRAVNTKITLTAQAYDGSGDYQYRYQLRDPLGTWSVPRPYAGDPSWAWTPVAPGTYTVRVDARSVGSLSSYEATNSMSYLVGLDLTVARAGSGSGTVTSSPWGIGCGSTCSAPFAQGTLVTLTAAPVAGSVFAGWSGACAGGGACQVEMYQSTSATAHFVPASSVTWRVVGGVKEACVDRADALATALVQAGWDGYPNRIKVVQGLYRGVFSFEEHEDLGLEFLGGYTAGCLSRGYDPGRTALSGDLDGDGDADAVPLSLSTRQPAGTGPLFIERLQIQEGRNDADSGGCVRIRGAAGNITLRGNVVAACAAFYGAGVGIEATAGSMLLQNNLVFWNVAEAAGGGIGIATVSGNLAAVNNTISDNVAGSIGGGIAAQLQGDTASADLQNNLIWRNSLNPAAGCADAFIDSDWDGNLTSAPVTFDYNDADLTQGVCVTDPAFTPGSGNVHDVDPGFLDPSHGWYAISPSSPVVNLGNGGHASLPATDYAGEPRTFGGGVDLGADEVVTGVATVSLNASLSSPQVVNTAVTFEASATGGPGAEYQFWLQDPLGSWSVVRAYDTDATWQWTPSLGGTYRVRVYARSAGSTRSYEASYSMSFVIIPPRVTSVILGANLPSAQAVGTEITFDAQASGGSGDYEYRFWLRQGGGSWMSVQGYDPSDSWKWTPAVAGGYQVMVYARSVGRPYSYDATYSRSFVITP